MKIKLLFLFPLLFLNCSGQTDFSGEVGAEPSPNPLEVLGLPLDPAAQSYQEICVRGEEKKGPWNNDLLMTWLDENGSPKQDDEIFVEAGGVPTLIQDADNRLIAAFQWFPCDDSTAFDQIAVSISSDNGASWGDPKVISIEDYPEDFLRPYDPTLTLLSDGQIRLYFTSFSMAEKGQLSNIYSAISDDGLNFVFEEGARFDLSDAAAYDSAVGYWNGLWHLITPKNEDGPTGEAYHATSTDGLEFETLAPIDLSEDINWTGNFYAKNDAIFFYGTPGRLSDGSVNNWFTFSTDGETWSAPESLDINFGDPALVCIENNSCLVIGVDVQP